ncbi:polymer-forming cytoskeletal protein [Deinococcus sonorensis]|uniref:Polymer-forming cytoskeletal protein n=2 Tax=Deinococcus sonorensis TaxID=309891 RepID=A0AAU7U8H2_9DEIO
MPPDPRHLQLLHRAHDGDLTDAEAHELSHVRQSGGQDFARLEAALDDTVRQLRSSRVPEPAVSVAPGLVADIRLAALLTRAAPPPMPGSVAASVAARVARASVSAAPVDHQLATLPRPLIPRSVAPGVAAMIRREAQATQAALQGQQQIPAPDAAFPGPSSAARNPAPLALVLGLVAALLLLVLRMAWPNLTAGRVVVSAVLDTVTPLSLAGVLLAVTASALIVWRPRPALMRGGGVALALAAALTVPALIGNVGRMPVSVGRTVTVHGPVQGDVLSVGGDINLEPGAQVSGQVVALLGNVRQQQGARVDGEVSALLGQVQGRPGSVSTPVAPLPGLPSLGTASAFRPVLVWLTQLGGPVWLTLYLLLLGALTLLMFVGGLAPRLATRQQRAPLHTLALGLLSLGALGLPLLALTLSGVLLPALMASLLLLLVLSVGLCVSLYDTGRVASRNLRLPHPELSGPLLGLATFALLWLEPAAATVVGLAGGIWGVGTLFSPAPAQERRL